MSSPRNSRRGVVAEVATYRLQRSQRRRQGRSRAQLRLARRPAPNSTRPHCIGTAFDKVTTVLRSLSFPSLPSADLYISLTSAKFPPPPSHPLLPQQRALSMSLEEAPQISNASCPCAPQDSRGPPGRIPEDYWTSLLHLNEFNYVPPPRPGLTAPSLPEPGRLGGRCQEQLRFTSLI
jgi:hypothetical protein